MPSPVVLPADTVRPEVSECRRMPCSLRPARKAAKPWAASWAMVTTCRVTDQAPGAQTKSTARTAVPATTQPAPSGRVVAGTAVLAVLLVWAPGAWSVTRHVVTIAHEAAHGFAAFLAGRKLHGIRLHSDTSGLT